MRNYISQMTRIITDSILCGSVKSVRNKKIMKQYLIIANDGKDDGALNRRKEVRPFHLAGAKKLKENSNFVIGGAMLDDDE